MSPSELDPRTRNAIISAIKRAFSRSALHRKVMDAAVSRTEKGPRGGKRYVCAKCTGTFSHSQVQVDHIDPVVPTNTLTVDMSFDDLVGRIWTDPKNLQVLCKPCHKAKSAEENKARRQKRKRKSQKKAGRIPASQVKSRR